MVGIIVEKLFDITHHLVEIIHPILVGVLGVLYSMIEVRSRSLQVAVDEGITVEDGGKGGLGVH